MLVFEVRENVSTSSHATGDRFSLVLVDGVDGSGGASLRAGAAAMGVVTDAHKSTGPNDDALLAVRISSVEAGGSQQEIGGVVQSTEIDSSSRDSGCRGSRRALATQNASRHGNLSRQR
jgi:hypothetical protein